MIKSFFSRQYFFWFILMAILSVDCFSRNAELVIEDKAETVETVVLPGAEQLGAYVPLLKNKKASCVVNHSSLIGKTHLVDTLLSIGIDIVNVFAPEHGFRGDVSDGEWIPDGKDPDTGLPIISLYGKTKKPTAESLKGVEVVIFDIQDVGVRFYTYLSTLHLVMEACAEENIPLIVLDRPNPHMHYIDGPVLENAFTSFIGMHPVPVVYGMSIGEYALMINGEGWLSDGLKANLEVIPVKNLKRNHHYSLTIAPSPNLPSQLSVLLYPSLCFFEGTMISVGRGTDKPFQCLGHPGLTQFAYHFTPKPNKGSINPPQKNIKCYGEDLSLIYTDLHWKPDRLDISYLLHYYSLIKRINQSFFIESSHFNRLAGTDQLQKQIESGWSEDEIRKSWQPGLDKFERMRDKYLIYP
ncbi:MAG TPA: DUF1343 domain-containing protein [Saprospiraceae bacterium]|nr:DUF1343 domain-containing protein [Saprospiraceae bacterium]